MKTIIVGIILVTALTIGCAPPHQPDSKVNPSTIRIGLAGSPDRINPILSRSAYARQIQSKIFLPLLSYDPVSLELVPCLAQSLPEVEHLENNKTRYTFEIHPEALWDDGSPVTVYDYIFTLKIVFNPWSSANAYRHYLSVIDAVLPDPDNPKKFTVISQSDYLLQNIAVGNFEIYPAYFYDPEGLLRDVELTDLKQLQRDPDAPNQKTLQAFAATFEAEKYSLDRHFISGCGPYQIEEWIADQQIILSKKNTWWGTGLMEKYPALQARPNTLHYKIIADRFAAIAALKSGELDVLSSIPPMDFKKLKENPTLTSELQFLSPPVLQYYQMAINNDRITDVSVRSALAALVDINKIIDNLAYNSGTPIVGPIHPQKKYYNDTLSIRPFDLEKAKSLLSIAGWKDLDGDGIRERKENGQTKELELSLTINPKSTTDKNFALIFQANARKAGIVININNQAFNQSLDDFKSGNYDLFMVVVRQSTSPDNLFPKWHSSSIGTNGSNLLRFAHPEVDIICEKIRQVADEEERTHLYRQFQEIIYRNQPAVFLYSFKENIALNKSLEASGTILRPGYQENLFYFR